jgi:Ca2+-dependent lipid-binding protein
LKAADVGGTSDPLVVLSLKGLLKKKHRTATISNTVNPIWNEEFVLEPHHPEKDVLVIKVYDKDVVKNDLLGMVRIPVFPYFNRGPIDEWRSLVTKTGQPARGDVHIQVNWGTNPISQALPDSASMMNNRLAYQDPLKPGYVQQPGGMEAGRAPLVMPGTTTTTTTTIHQL